MLSILFLIFDPECSRPKSMQDRRIQKKTVTSKLWLRPLRVFLLIALDFGEIGKNSLKRGGSACFPLYGSIFLYDVKHAKPSLKPDTRRSGVNSFYHNKSKACIGLTAHKYHGMTFHVFIT